MADVNGAVAANVNGDVEDPAAAATLDASKGEQPETLTNGSTVVQQDEQPADTLQPADAPATTEVQSAPETSTEQNESAAPTVEAPTAAATTAPTEPDSRPAVLIIGGLGMLYADTI